MKYVIVQGDGMADRPLEELSGRTPLEAANATNMDEVASAGEFGLVNTIPEGLPPGSSVGNMSLMGLDPEKYFTGRAPLEARGRGLDVGKDDVVFRCNLVKLGRNGKGTVMEDYSGGHPSSAEAEKYIGLLDEEIGKNGFNFHKGVSYRNLLIWKGGRKEVDFKNISLTPPHDITGEPVGEYLPEGSGSEKLNELQERAGNLLEEEKTSGLNGIWLWGEGVKPELPTFKERYGLSGAVISAVDLIKGLGSYTGLRPAEVDGANGSIDTDYGSKVDAAIDYLEDDSIVFIHVEAPDEASHAGDLEQKIEAIERIDSRVVAPLLDHLAGRNDSKFLLVTDHITGLDSRTHERGAVPFALTEFSGPEATPWRGFTEEEASNTGTVFQTGMDLIDNFLRREVSNGSEEDSLYRTGK